jgi:hypothetical protein
MKQKKKGLLRFWNIAKEKRCKFLAIARKFNQSLLSPYPLLIAV